MLVVVPPVGPVTVVVSDVVSVTSGLFVVAGRVVEPVIVENEVVLLELVVVWNDVTVAEDVVLVVGVVTVTMTWFTCCPTGVAVTWKQRVWRMNASN